MEFTSLSPDAQIISIGIISDCGNSFYAEFSDFDINRCDDWVKENVVSKLEFYPKVGNSNKDGLHSDANPFKVGGTFDDVKFYLKEWLSQFSDYQIQFVCDCGTWDWYWLVQLLAEWESRSLEVRNGDKIYDIGQEKGFGICCMGDYELILKNRTGLPKLPDNISPVPSDLNDLIAFKKGITPKEAFDLNREELCIDVTDTELWQSLERIDKHSLPQKHNALWDAKVIKEIYQKMK